MSVELTDILAVLAYLVLGTIGIALLVGWALKRPGPPKK
jgi:hypothetical protein